MTWSYDDTLSTNRDLVRLEIGDTVSTDQQLSNEAIDQALAQRSSVIQAAILCCDRIIAKYARLVTQSVGPVSVSYGERMKNYEELISRLRLRAPAVSPFAGGTSVAGKEAAAEDTDRDAPIFSVGMFDRKY